MTFTIRDARDDDDWDLIGLIAGCWSEYPGCVLDVHGEVPELLGIASYGKRCGGRFWIAESDGRLVASIGILPGPGTDMVTLTKLYVARSARRQGMAARLVDLVENEARARNARTIELWSDTRFLDAHRFYERHGYTRHEQTRALHDLSNSIEYRFTKDLEDIEKTPSMPPI
ncbi:MAG: GNAT family N-acetyltransferase [Actinomycetota bacterium]